MNNATGYSNNPAEGQIYKGISRNLHPSWGGWKYVDGVIALTTTQPHFGTGAYASWVEYLDKKLAELNQLQRLVVDFNYRKKP